ncbi:metalloenzyme [Catenaria anguillulae PL171]|uniref:phosphoglycerate mutase (2,3-diphosphoglycerate-independent) n=1 Tax=Catenaria anguillulae PL171 TaxID=765915 RepID=A0A1Y2I4G6_9FUNG|nr:metalloenzyme [Catenaria anguillulae PL171]
MSSQTPAMPAEATLNLAPQPLSAASPTMPIDTPVCLIAIDGWGVSPDPNAKGDAVRDATTPAMDKLRNEHGYTTLAAHGLSVGLPDGLMGNSEVGHLNIGAGRVVYQDIVRIDLAVKRETIGKLEAVKAAFERAKEGNGRCTLLISDGGVHSHQEHLYALLRAARLAGVPQTYIHFIGDGRDTSPKSAAGYLQQLFDYIHTKNQGYGKLATIIGRYMAMDRDKRWERVQEALDMYIHGKGELVQAQDTIFTFNYRSDRMRQLVASLDARCKFSPLAETVGVPAGLHITNMTQYKADFPFPVAFPAQTMDNCLAEVLAAHAVPQCHIAETEKYAHVTFFFNGGCEKQFPGEDRVLIPSPKVATYDLQPGMSAALVGDAVAATLATKKYPFVMCNFAPPDMVGHTGKYDPAVIAVGATDKAIGVIADACAKFGYALVVTADHGNAEKMVDETTGQPHTAHTTARVPLAIMHPKGKPTLKLPQEEGKQALCDVAPTVLKIMGLPIPKEMDGEALVA